MWEKVQGSLSDLCSHAKHQGTSAGGPAGAPIHLLGQLPGNVGSCAEGCGRLVDRPRRPATKWPDAQPDDSLYPLDLRVPNPV